MRISDWSSDVCSSDLMWQEDKSPEAPGRLENLKELIGALGEFENFAGFLDHVALVMDTENSEDAEMVSLMTLHAAKGLEFDYIFLPGWEEELDRKSVV